MVRKIGNQGYDLQFHLRQKVGLWIFGKFPIGGNLNFSENNVSSVGMILTRGRLKIQSTNIAHFPGANLPTPIWPAWPASFPPIRKRILPISKKALLAMFADVAEFSAHMWNGNRYSLPIKGQVHYCVTVLRY